MILEETQQFKCLSYRGFFFCHALLKELTHAQFVRKANNQNSIVDLWLEILSFSSDKTTIEYFSFIFSHAIDSIGLTTSVSETKIPRLRSKISIEEYRLQN